jgi:hypothetical protein
MKNRILLSLLAIFTTSILLTTCTLAATAKTPYTPQEIETWWKAGKTLPLETTAKYPIPELNIKDDTGINVLIDMAHKCDFFTLWNLSRHLHNRGLRTTGSHATLDTLLTPGSPCRIRIPVADKVNPFAWWPTPKFNVVLTEGGQNDPAYIFEEHKALKKFIADGGGLVISASWVKDIESARKWSLNKLLNQYGASTRPTRQTYNGKKFPTIRTDQNWEIVLKSEEGKPIYARRKFGKGRIALFASSALYRFDKKNKQDVEQKADFLAKAIKWASAGSPPAGGDKRMPTPMWGGGGIYQESEKTLDGIVCYYSKNQIPELLRTVDKDFPTITEDIYAWLPSPKPTEPMYLILCSGGGGGWAVNAYLPKEASTISTSSNGIRSIFAHEQAHTMSGPGQAANHPFGGNRGEEHAGWFQGKINAKYNGDKGPNRKCNQVIQKQYNGTQKTPEQIYKKANLDKWTTGHDRMMIWYAWQKIDDRYGPTWYPRWRWVQHQRWKNTPKRKLTWEESIEDMSIAVGEDLFPFFAKTGKQLARKRFEKTTFMGKQLSLPIAPIQPTPPGNVNLDPIGDYTKPIKPK